MKIVLDLTLLLEKERTGVGQYGFNLAQELSQMLGRDLLKLVVRPISLDQEAWQKELKIKPPFYFLAFPQRFSRKIIGFWQKINWPKVEALTETNLYHSFGMTFLPSKKGVGTVFDLTPLLFPLWYPKKTVENFKRNLSYLKTNAQAIICCSENTRNDLHQYTGFPKEKIFVIYPGINKVFLKKINPIRTLKNWGIKRNFFLMVGVANLRKNLSNVLKAYWFLKRRNEAFPQLVLVGRKNKNLNQSLKRFPKEIISLGFLKEEDLACLYQTALALLYPSFYEGFGLPIIEAMASGCPVICAKNSSLEEAAGEASLYVDPHNPLEIAKAMQTIKIKKGLRRQLVAKGLREAQKFSWQESAKQTLKVYQRLTKLTLPNPIP